MTNKEIEKIKQELYEIQRIPDRHKQLDPIQSLAKRVEAPIPPQLHDKQTEYINETIRSIHKVLQTEMMFNACIFAKRSCFWAAIASIAALVGVIVTLCLK